MTLNQMLGLDDDDPKMEVQRTVGDSRSSRVKEKGDIVQEHEKLLRDSWHRNAVSMAYSPQPENLYTGNRERSLRGFPPLSTPTILEEEDSSLASE
jgi:hypothetical protein